MADRTRTATDLDVPFGDRRSAGRALGAALAERPELVHPIVLGLPRGGVPVAIEVARALNAPLDVFVVRKLGMPGHEELAMGAIASGGVQVLNEDVVRQARIGEDAIARVADDELQELIRREERYRSGRGPLDLEGRDVVLVDDGLATGASMRAAVRAVREHRPSRVVIAVPVGPPDTCEELRQRGDEVVCLATPQPFMGVGRWYRSFPQTQDDEVTRLLELRSQEIEQD